MTAEMTSFEDLFNSSVLQVFAPGSALGLPDSVSREAGKEWLSRLYAESTDRKVAFFDEVIDFLLVIRFPHTQDDSEDLSETITPPLVLLSFLAHLQISYEASYISPFTSVPSTSSGAVPEIGRPPPRTTSINKDKPVALLAASHPTIFPPATPNPVPSAAKSDQQYVQSQGTQLTTGVWGEPHPGSTRLSSEAFALLWAEEEKEWVAVYRMSVLVRYMSTKFEDPLLSLTVSTTLREKPLPVTPPRKALVALLEEVGGSSDPSDILSPIKSAVGPGAGFGDQADDEDLLSGLEEINLLEGLQADPTFSTTNDEPLRLPSTRLGPKTRRTAFALPPAPGSSQPQQSRASLMASAAAKTKLPPPPASATFRKSFRKTMKVVSGFHVRMRTVFVPYFLLPHKGQRNRKTIASGTADADDSDDDNDDIESREQREAGNEEHTVVLSVEIENTFPDIPSPTIPNYSFEVERADVTVSGTGAKTVLVGWGDEAEIFPVRIGPNEQVNLLYAVSFLRAPEIEEMTTATGTGGQAGKRTSVASAAAAAQEMRRSVSINISVRPFDGPTAAVRTDEEPLSYPTRTYASYWSCKLNFSTATSSGGVRSSEDGHDLIALPTPASPFPHVQGRVPTIVTQTAQDRSSRPPSLPITNVAGSRRFTSTALDSPSIDGRHKAKSPVNYQGPTAMLNPANQPQSAIPLTADPRHPNPIITGTSPGGGSRAAFLPPSVAFQSTYARSPTTYTSPQDSYFTFAALQGQPQLDVTGAEEPGTPRTPAYPAYPGSPPPIPPTLYWQAPLAQHTGAGAVGPTVDMRRDRGTMGTGSVPTPGLTVPGFPSNVEVSAEVENKAEAGGQPIVVSVGLLPIVREGTAKGKRRVSGDIYPLDQFTLDIFVFNQSSWTRRFEVSHPNERRRRRQEKSDGKKADGGLPGIMPLENRVRIGPLLPSTCQSVRMDFLALTPGVHPIRELVLTDVHSGFSMHLRSIMDVVICEP